MAQTTRTLNPLPFNDLEPHRFEDLVRQLAYDFRLWKKLEAIGRSGGDEGIDIRGIEAVAADVTPADQESDEDETVSEESVSVVEERIWVIQCKREKSIGPKKAREINSINRRTTTCYLRTSECLYRSAAALCVRHFARISR